MKGLAYYWWEEDEDHYWYYGEDCELVPLGFLRLKEALSDNGLHRMPEAMPHPLKLFIPDELI